MKKDIKKLFERLKEIEEKTIEEFLNYIENLEHQKDLVIKSSNETIRSYGFKNKKLFVNVYIVEGKPTYGTVLSEVESY